MTTIAVTSAFAKVDWAQYRSKPPTPAEAINPVPNPGQLNATPHAPPGTAQRLKLTTEILARLQAREQETGFRAGFEHTIPNMKRLVAHYQRLSELPARPQKDVS